MKKQNYLDSRTEEERKNDHKLNSVTTSDKLAKDIKENNEKIIQKLIEFRDLRPNEKENSLDYWQGHTDAIRKAVILLRNKDEK